MGGQLGTERRKTLISEQTKGGGKSGEVGNFAKTSEREIVRVKVASFEEPEREKRGKRICGELTRKKK